MNPGNTWLSYVSRVWKKSEYYNHVSKKVFEKTLPLLGPNYHLTTSQTIYGRAKILQSIPNANIMGNPNLTQLGSVWFWSFLSYGSF